MVGAATERRAEEFIPKGGEPRKDGPPLPAPRRAVQEIDSPSMWPLP